MAGYLGQKSQKIDDIFYEQPLLEDMYTFLHFKNRPCIYVFKNIVFRKHFYFSIKNLPCIEVLTLAKSPKNENISTTTLWRDY